MKFTATLLVATALLFSANVVAQNIQTSTIDWNSSSTFDAEQGIITDEPTKVTSSGEQITWYNNDNSVRKEMSITATFGSWTNVASNGSITFNVNSGDSSGVVQFWKTDDEKKIRILLVSRTGNIIYELTIANE